MEEKNVIKVKSVNMVHEWYGLGKSKNPLITLVDYSKMKNMKPMEGYTFISDLYIVSMKKIPSDNAMKYGRKHYDFQEGTLMFIAPGQILTIETEETPTEGWGLYFHPDLIRKTNLGQNIKKYSFFSYNVYEALHLSEDEKTNLKSIADKIEQEYSNNLDEHSYTLIASNLELFLNYCDRYYNRQFLTRKHVNNDTVIRFEKLLEEYFNSDKPQNEGLPTVSYCAEQMNYSKNYLSDLLKKETGKTTLEHIHYYIIDLAKTILLSQDKNVQETAYQLGFEYPQQFSRLFKKETGISPAEYKKIS